MDKVAKTLATKSARSIYRDHLFKSSKFNCWTLELVRWLWSSDCSDTWPTFYPCKKLLVLLKSHDWHEWRWPCGRVCKFQSCRQLIADFFSHTLISSHTINTCMHTCVANSHESQFFCLSIFWFLDIALLLFCHHTFFPSKIWKNKGEISTFFNFYCWISSQ